MFLLPLLVLTCRHVSAASLLLALERFDESEAEFAELLDMNADNYEYHTGLQCAHCKVVEKREYRRHSLPLPRAFLFAQVSMTCACSGSCGII